jgi:membrane-associated phospholipid phosphatase
MLSGGSAEMASKMRGKSAGSVLDADVNITDELGEHNGSLPAKALSKFSKLGDQPELRVISAGLLAAGLVIGNERMSRAGMRMLIAHELATAAKDFVKNRIDRTRPRNARDRRQSKTRPGESTATERTSFPSGHSAGAVAVAQAFAREFPEQRAPALAAAGLISLGQVPKRAHYPTDVAAGAILGAACEALVYAVWPAVGRSRLNGLTPSIPPPASRPRA